jgi:hypothetical protein
MRRDKDHRFASVVDGSCATLSKPDVDLLVILKPRMHSGRDSCWERFAR